MREWARSVNGLRGSRKDPCVAGRSLCIRLLLHAKLLGCKTGFVHAVDRFACPAPWPCPAMPAASESRTSCAEKIVGTMGWGQPDEHSDAALLLAASRGLFVLAALSRLPGEHCSLCARAIGFFTQPDSLGRCCLVARLVNAQHSPTIWQQQRDACKISEKSLRGKSLTEDSAKRTHWEGPGARRRLSLQLIFG